MCLLAYRSSKNKTTGVTPAELYLAQDLRLAMDLLRENLPSKRELDMAIDCISRVRKKLEDFHEVIRKRVDIFPNQNLVRSETQEDTI